MLSTRCREVGKQTVSDWLDICGMPFGVGRSDVDNQLKGLILAQNERWRRGLGMQVAREPRKGGQRRKGQ